MGFISRNKKVLGFLITTILCKVSIAQDGNILQQLFEEEKQTVEAIALYPEQERNAILEASSHPEILARMESMQARTQEGFQESIMKLSQEDQKRMYDLVRYPDLIIAATADGKRKKDAEIKQLTEGYAEEVQQNLLWANSEHFPTLAVISNLYKSSENNFEVLLERYSEDTKNAYRDLVKLPEIVQILTENMNTTVLLGDIYRQNPNRVKAKLDSLNTVVAEQKSKELNEWKQSLEENPEALNEYQEAAQEFAQEEGYNEKDYEEPLPKKYTTTVYVNYIWRPYPYWFGWPYWYSYSWWYPYPWWYHWGYYYGPDRTIVFVGLPSHTFVHWHFNHPRHFYYYPHFTNAVIRYTDRHPREHDNVTRVVRSWEQDIRPEVPNNWLNNDPKRVERIKEYGSFRMDYDKEVQAQSVNAPTERQFLERNANRYPTLKPVLKEKPAMERIQTPREQVQMPPKQQPVERNQPIQRQEPANPQQEPRMEKPPVQQNPKQQPESQQQRIRVIEKPPTQQQQIEKARDHHENVWEQQPKVQPRQQQPVPQRPVPQKRVEPMRQAEPQRMPTQKPAELNRQQPQPQRAQPR